MKKTTIILTLMALLFLGSLSGCGCTHTWNNATCFAPKTCSDCGETMGETLPHQWIDATCETPLTCVNCGEAFGNAIGHRWKEATCLEAKTCLICSKTEGFPAEHQWNDATCQKAKTCSVCNTTEGFPSEHLWSPATVNAPKTCEICGKTEGSKLQSSSGAVGVYNTMYKGDSYTIFLNSDGSYIFSCSANDEDEIGTWKQSGKKIYTTYITEDGSVTDSLQLVTNGLTSGSLYYKKIG